MLLAPGNSKTGVTAQRQMGLTGPAQQVWDSSGSGCVRYSAADAGERVMGHVVENDVLQAALLGQLRRPRAATELLWPARPHGHSLLLCASSCGVPRRMLLPGYYFIATHAISPCHACGLSVLWPA